MLFARVRSLTRLKLVIDELRQREASGRRMGVIAGAGSRLAGPGRPGAGVDDNERQARRVLEELSVEHRPVVEADPDKALDRAPGALWTW
jgi:two-component system cell cycle response regulator